MSKSAYNLLEGVSVPHHVSEIEIIGSLINDAGRPVELDMFLNDDQGQRFAINVMTLKRYEQAKLEQPDMETEESAPHVLVVNEDVITMDSLIELLKAPDIRIFEPYLIAMDEL